MNNLQLLLLLLLTAAATRAESPGDAVTTTVAVLGVPLNLLSSRVLAFSEPDFPAPLGALMLRLGLRELHWSATHGRWPHSLAAGSWRPAPSGVELWWRSEVAGSSAAKVVADVNTLLGEPAALAAVVPVPRFGMADTWYYLDPVASAVCATLHHRWALLLPPAQRPDWFAAVPPYLSLTVDAAVLANGTIAVNFTRTHWAAAATAADAACVGTKAAVGLDRAVSGGVSRGRRTLRLVATIPQDQQHARTTFIQQVVPVGLRILRHTVAIEGGENASIKLAALGRALWFSGTVPPGGNRSSTVLVSAEMEPVALPLAAYPPAPHRGVPLPPAMMAVQTAEAEEVAYGGDVYFVPVPLPDFSLPFNTVALTSTVAAAAFGLVLKAVS